MSGDAGAAEATRVRFAAADGEVSGILLRPPEVRGLFVLGHGAGAGMGHPFLEGLARALADRGLATFRYQFPYMERGRRMPDRHPVLEATVRAAVREARDRLPGSPCVAGGKSMSGRMTSQAAAREPLEGVRGLVFVGFPLHPAGRPGVERAEHLSGVKLPMLFLQGTRDRLADADLLRPVLARLGRAVTLHEVVDADHGFAVPRRAGRGPEEVREELAAVVARWTVGLEAAADPPTGR